MRIEAAAALLRFEFIVPITYSKIRISPKFPLEGQARAAGLWSRLMPYYK
jgi:hypothetical protein